MCHHHAFLAAQDELFSVLSRDFCIERLSKSEGNKGAMRRMSNGWVSVLGEDRAEEFRRAGMCHVAGMITITSLSLIRFHIDY